jgi:hypothetical protein
MSTKLTKNKEAEDLRRRLVEDECDMLTASIQRLQARQALIKKALQLHAERAGK